jgi:hypothetical protein
MASITDQVPQYGTYGAVPNEMKGNIRNDMYLTNEALRRMDKLVPKRRLIIYWIYHRNEVKRLDDRTRGKLGTHVSRPGATYLMGLHPLPQQKRGFPF